MENYEYYTIPIVDDLTLMSCDPLGTTIKVLSHYHIKTAYYGECGSSFCSPFEINNTIKTFEDFRRCFDAEICQVDHIDNFIMFRFLYCRLKSIWNIETKYNFILILEGEKNE